MSRVAYGGYKRKNYDIPSSFDGTDPRLGATHEQKVEAYQTRGQKPAGGTGFYGTSYGKPETEPPVYVPESESVSGTGGGQGGGSDSTPSYVQQFQPTTFQYTGTRPTFDYTGTGRPTFQYTGTRPEDFTYGVARPTDFTYGVERPEDFTYGVTRPEDFTYGVERPEDFAYGEQRPEYQSRYDERIQEMLDKIMGRGEFSYDYSTDPLYQQYAESYGRMGQQAMQDTLAQVSARTGGLASSYAGTAAQGAYNNYMQALNDKIPELQKLAYSMWRDQAQDDQAQLGILQGLESQDYGRYRDTTQDWSEDRQLAYQQWLQQQQRYGEDRDFAYRQWLQGQDQWSEDRQLAYQQWLQRQQQYGEDRDFAYRQWLQGQDQWEGDRDFAYQQWLQQQQQWEGDRDFAWQQYRLQDQDWDTDREWRYRGYQDELSQYDQEYARQYRQWQDEEAQRYQQYLAQLQGTGGGSTGGSGGGSGTGGTAPTAPTGESGSGIDESLLAVMQMQGIGGYDEAYQFLVGQGYNPEYARSVAQAYMAR